MFYQEIENFIKENETFSSFTGGVEENKIIEVEEALNVRLPNSYKWFLTKYGYGAVFGQEILGCGKSEVPSVVLQTKRFRQLGLPEQYVVIQNCDEWIYCLDTNGLVNYECPVISWDRVNGLDEIESSNFSSFILNAFEEAKEDWEDEV